MISFATWRPSLRSVGTGGALAVFLLLSFMDGGYFSREFFIGAVAMWVILGLLFLFLWDRVDMVYGVSVPVIALAAVCVWSLISVVWSIGPNLSLEEFARESLYFAGFAAVLTGPRNRTGITLATSLFVLLTAGIAAFALSANIFPGASQQYLYAGGRLIGSIGYWNGLAALMVMAILPCLWLSASASIPRLARVAATLALVLLSLTLFFTLSRGALLIGIGSVALYLALARERLGAILSLISALVPGGIVILYTISSLPSLQTAATGDRISAADGRSFALALLAALAAAALIKSLSLFLPASLPRTRTGLAIAACGWFVVLALAGGAAYHERHRISAKISEWRSASAVSVVSYNQGGVDTRGFERLASTSNDRTEFWRIGLVNFSEHPLGGSGAGTYTFVNARLRSVQALARDPHSIWVRFLSDQGLIGFLLITAFVISLIGVYLGKLWVSRLTGTRLWRNGLYLALGISCLAWLADASIEWIWALPAVTLPFFILAGLALRLGESTEDEGNEPEPGNPASAAGGNAAMPVWARGLIVGAAMLFSTFTMVMLVSVLESESAANALSAGDLSGAESAARLAHRLDYFAVGPLYTLAEVADRNKDYPAARDLMASAVSREPQSSKYQEELALIEFYDLKEVDAGLSDLNIAVNLDPQYQPLHLELQRMYADSITYKKTGVMPARPKPSQT